MSKKAITQLAGQVFSQMRKINHEGKPLDAKITLKYGANGTVESYKADGVVSQIATSDGIESNVVRSAVVVETGRTEVNSIVDRIATVTTGVIGNSIAVDTLNSHAYVLLETKEGEEAKFVRTGGGTNHVNINEFSRVFEYTKKLARDPNGQRVIDNAMVAMGRSGEYKKDDLAVKAIVNHGYTAANTVTVGTTASTSRENLRAAIQAAYTLLENNPDTGNGEVVILTGPGLKFQLEEAVSGGTIDGSTVPAMALDVVSYSPIKDTLGKQPIGYTPVPADSFYVVRKDAVHVFVGEEDGLVETAGVGDLTRNIQAVTRVTSLLGAYADVKNNSVKVDLA